MNPSRRLSENAVTPEEVYLNRRKFLQRLGWAGLQAAALAGLPGIHLLAQAREAPAPRPGGRLVSPLSTADAVSPESIVSRYNNFYEFGVDKGAIWRLAQGLNTSGWEIHVGGRVRKPRILDARDLIRRMPVEERIYRLRCVEAWSVVIPWTGFPLNALVRFLDPLPSARYVRFTSFLDPNIARGQKTRFWEPWPYREALTLEEAAHELSFIATGIYGHELPPQHGAPLRLVVPWKYGFKSIKSITRIDFTRDRPGTFWREVSPLEYDFWANIDPAVPYARWHQQFERVPGGGRLETRPYNGYAARVAHLYLKGK